MQVANDSYDVADVVCQLLLCEISRLDSSDCSSKGLKTLSAANDILLVVEGLLGVERLVVLCNSYAAPILGLLKALCLLHIVHPVCRVDDIATVKGLTDACFSLLGKVCISNSSDAGVDSL